MTPPADTPRPSSTRPSIVVAYVLDAFAVVGLAIVIALLTQRDSQIEPQEAGFFGFVVPLIVLIAAASAAVGAGVVAARSLIREPLHSRLGRASMGLVVIGSVVAPAAVALVLAISALVGREIPASWADPLNAVWPIAGALAVATAVLAKGDPARRRFLVPPVAFGGFVLTFVILEVLGNQ